MLAELDVKRPAGGYAAAGAAAATAWGAYRDASCRPDRTAAFDGIGEGEARNYCLVEHAIRRLATLRADLDRFRFILASSE